MLSSRADVNEYLNAVQAAAGPSIVDLEPAVARQMMRQAGPMMDLPAREMPRRDVVVASPGGHGVPVRIYHPVAVAGPAPAIVFYHGGGWVFGDIDGYDPLCSEIAHQMGMTLVSVDYRLGPEHFYPAAIDDSRAATRWVGCSPEAVGHVVSGLILVGDSAGGSLAAALARDLLGALPAPILAQWLIYPVTDLSKLYASDIELSQMFGLTDEGRDKFYRHYFGDDDVEAKKADPMVSPLLGSIWRGLPPAVVFTCTLDPLRDQGRAFAAKLVAAGVETIFYEGQGQVHASFTMRKLLPSAQQDLLKGVSALKLMLP